jgi:hypothetical protein
MSATDASAVAPPGVDTLDWELKYLLRPSLVQAALASLGATCLPDSKHPHNVVVSVYYDTPGMQSVYEKINSDYLKTKVRVRWYEPSGVSGKVFLEAKYRIGGRREKVRVVLPQTSDSLTRRPLRDPLWRALPAKLQAEGVYVPPALAPVFMVRYERHRFTEIWQRARLTVDSHIDVPAVNTDLFPTVPLRELDTAVLEVKVRAGEPNQLLARLDRLGCRRESFSKYTACYQLITGVTL